ncbi:hypothetical protein KKC1_10140 [Calderihabitans maritimus]|uniref:Uncharacterized protein n=1 Tax=Calderihabitans maritimus TaxID=1246530 RepID=A0A1Z5HQP3_9FIRM|nr:hypothetical protein KKC1_10140 [Calderihabitans maritimus]
MPIIKNSPVSRDGRVTRGTTLVGCSALLYRQGLPHSLPAITITGQPDPAYYQIKESGFSQATPGRPSVVSPDRARTLPGSLTGSATYSSPSSL